MKLKLIIIAGGAGTGKTTISKEIIKRFSSVFLDRDTVGTKFADKILELSGQDTNDRDSSFYHQHIRNLEYETTVDVALENLDLGQNVLMVAPFSSELANKDWLPNTLSKIGLSNNEVDTKVIVVSLTNKQLQKERISVRGAERDSYKLDNWDEFTQTTKQYNIAWDIPPSAILHYDNSQKLSVANISKIIEFIKA